ncbi:hypothetical protein OG349_31580 [Streptomyces sp. NBC_01317]|nr:hypothetical protein OG349_31580 [Streptomyces sp. NBC_01317]
MDTPAGTGDIRIRRLAEGALGITESPQWSQRFAHLLARPGPRPAARAS